MSAPSRPLPQVTAALARIAWDGVLDGKPGDDQRRRLEELIHLADQAGLEVAFKARPEEEPYKPGWMAKTWDMFVSMLFVSIGLAIALMLVEFFTGWTPGGIHLHPLGGH